MNRVQQLYAVSGSGSSTPHHHLYLCQYKWTMFGRQPLGNHNNIELGDVDETFRPPKIGCFSNYLTLDLKYWTTRSMMVRVNETK